MNRPPVSASPVSARPAAPARAAAGRTASGHHAAVGPTEERLEFLDVLRGVALLGIFLMNMPGFSTSFHIPEAVAERLQEDRPWWDTMTTTVLAWWGEGKFNGLYTLLFGLGLALQWERLPGGAQSPVVLRRLVVLGGIGALHMTLLWSGDVLHIYAVLGLILLMLHHWSARRLAVLALGVYGLQILHGVVTRARWTEPRYRAEQAFLGVEYARDTMVYGAGTWWQGVQLRAEQALLNYTEPFLQVPMGWFWIALLNTALLGLCLSRAGCLQPNGPWVRWLRQPQGLRALLLALAVSVGLTLVGLWLQEAYAAGEAPSLRVVAGWAVLDAARLVLVLLYAAAVQRWCLGSWGLGLRRALATAGRMPLTQYLLQSVMGTALFHGWGLGLWGSVGSLAQTLLALGLFAGVQIPLAYWWFRRHPLGPVEALWRRLSYGPSTPR